MNNKSKLLIIIVALVVVIAVAAVLYGALAPDNAGDNIAGEEQVAVVAAPDFIVFDGDGKPVSLSDFKGKPVVINFWASFCPPCKAEMPAFNEAYQKYGDKVEFMMINAIDNVQETAESGKAFIADSDFEFPVYYDLEKSACVAYGVRTLPATFFINADGNILAYAVSAITLENIEQCIQLITE